jgi:hypothetical protein
MRNNSKNYGKKRTILKENQTGHTYCRITMTKFTSMTQFKKFTVLKNLKK